VPLRKIIDMPEILALHARKPSNAGHRATVISTGAVLAL
jgi:hypothetical protein